MSTPLKSSKKLWAVVAIFVVPMILGWLLYHYHQYFSFKTTNHGIFVDPPVTSVAMPNPNTWRIIYATATACDSACAATMQQLHQLQKALGKDHDRVAIIQTEKTQSLQKAFITQGRKDFVVTDKIFLMDPLGNIFMYYPANTDPMNILKDIKHVLGVSQIG